MHIVKLNAILAVAVVLILNVCSARQNPCFAQEFSTGVAGDTASDLQPTSGRVNFGDASGAYRGKPSAPLVVQEGPPVVLQGASCGTIGPQGLDATSIMGVTTGGPIHVTDSFPVIPTFLFSLLGLSTLAFALRTLVIKKRAPLWVVGSIAFAVLSLSGFIWMALTGKLSF
jgi:hypothetical protein